VVIRYGLFFSGYMLEVIFYRGIFLSVICKGLFVRGYLLGVIC
jgi:hypothetical protein